MKAVSQWLKEGRSPLFRLFGYAGTGKTTLARHFAEHVDGDVLFAAFTGKHCVRFPTWLDVRSPVRPYVHRFAPWR